MRDDILSQNLVISYFDIFNEIPNQLETYLTDIGRQNVLDILTFLLDSEYTKPTRTNVDDRSFLDNFFCEENFKIEIYKKLQKIRNNNTENTNFILVNNYTILQIFEFCFNNLKDEGTEEKSEIEKNIFKAILAQNYFNEELNNIAIESTKNLEPIEQFAAITISQSFIYSDIINYDIEKILITQIIKSIYFFEFLELNPKTNDILIEFLNNFNCISWKDFLKNILGLIFEFVKDNNITNVQIKNDENFEKNCNFIEKITQINPYTIPDYDFKHIRSKPLYKISNGVYKIISKVFLIELIHKGVYFKINEIHSKLNPNNKDKFRTFYCDEFSEKTLLYKTIEYIYQKKCKKFSGSEIKEYKIDAEPDYYIRNGNNIFLFESKDIFISSKIKETCDYITYKTELHKKLYFETNGKKTKNKAILQLIKNIKRILNKEFIFDNNYKNNLITIYPIIILHDRQLNINGLNFLVNYWFSLELKNNNIDDMKNIKPVTIIDIDSFIFYQDIFRDNKITLQTVIDEYLKFITFNSKRKYKNQNHVNQYYERTVIPFSNFLSKYIDEKKISKSYKILKQKGLTLF